MSSFGGVHSSHLTLKPCVGSIKVHYRGVLSIEADNLFLLSQIRSPTSESSRSLLLTHAGTPLRLSVFVATRACRVFSRCPAQITAQLRQLTDMTLAGFSSLSSRQDMTLARLSELSSQQVHTMKGGVSTTFLSWKL